MAEVKKLNKYLWDSRVDDWEYADATTIAFRSVGMEEPSAVDLVDVTEKQANQLCEIGMRHHIDEGQTAVKVFNIDVFFDDFRSNLADIIQPRIPYKGDLGIYGLKATFIERGGGIVCGISMDESHSDSGGTAEVAVLWLFDDFHGGYSVTPYSISEDGMYCTDYETLVNLGEWLGHFFDGVQYRMINRPEFVHIYHRRIPKEEREAVQRRTSGKARIVKVQKIISILAEEDKDVPVSHSSRTITMPVWGVSGHWRVCKSGKRVWVHPYKKGRDREKAEIYCGKKYQFVEEEQT